MSKYPAQDETAFRAAHDKAYIVPQRIRAALKELRNTWLYEGQFVKRFRISVTDFAKYRDQFDDCILTAPGKSGSKPKRVICGTSALAKKLRAIADKQ